MRVLLAGFAVLCAAACGGDGDDGDDSPDVCVGLECDVVNCAKQQQPPTTLTGTVHAPNGTLPLFGVRVYVPRARDTLPPLPEGAQCSRCTDELPGPPAVQILTDPTGKFRLENVPAGDNIPLVITTGKWRRQIVIPHVEACLETQISDSDTRLPRSSAEGDLPKIALTTGGGDSLECLIRRLGIDDSEVTTDAGTGRVHFYRGNGVYKFAAGTDFPSATTLWDSVDKLKQYDLVLLSCEGSQNSLNKPQTSLDAMKRYADLGGRVFASHWHNIWIQGATDGFGLQKPEVWPEIATWTRGATTAVDTIDLIDEMSNPKGIAFASWMVNVGGSTVRDEIPIANITVSGNTQSTGRTSCDSVKPDRGERWTYLKDQGGYTQNFQFTTPNELPVEERCGKVVFSDMHVSGNPLVEEPYPAACPVGELTPQEKALAFMFFDISSCVGPIF